MAKASISLQRLLGRGFGFQQSTPVLSREGSTPRNGSSIPVGRTVSMPSPGSSINGIISGEGRQFDANNLLVIDER